MEWLINSLVEIVKNILSDSDDEIKYDLEDEIVYREND